MRRLIGLRKAREYVKVPMIKKHPIRDRTDATRSRTTMAFTAPWGSSSEFAIGSVFANEGSRL